METYQLVGIAVMVGMGFVVHSTMSLNRLRNVMGVPKAMFNFRDLTVLRNPGDFDHLIRFHHDTFRNGISTGPGSRSSHIDRRRVAASPSGDRDFAAGGA